MSIYVLGINHKTAPIALREKVYFAAEQLPLYLQDLLGRGYVQEAVLLSTCNRSELYCEAHDVAAVKEWFCSQTASCPQSELESALYIYSDEEAVAHLMQVACGLDSMVLGEPQILGQVKEAFSESCSVNAVGALFHQLFQQVFSVAKEIRTSTAIGACPVSVASAAVHFAKQHIACFEQAKVVLIGAGDTTELMLRYLSNFVARPIYIVNRNLEKAAELAEKFGGKAYSFDELINVLADADLVFSATGSPLPILSKTMVAQAMQQRSKLGLGLVSGSEKCPAYQEERNSSSQAFQQKLLLIDIAVPRDIEASVAELPGVQLFCIDDLKAIIEQNRLGREHAADKARDLIQERSERFIIELKSIDKVAHTIRAYRGVIQEICQTELMKAKHQLRKGGDPSQVLETFAYTFTNKLLHTPSVQLRQAGAEGRLELLHFAKQLFAIPDVEVERL